MVLSLPELVSNLNCMITTKVSSLLQSISNWNMPPACQGLLDLKWETELSNFIDACLNRITILKILIAVDAKSCLMHMFILQKKTFVWIIHEIKSPCTFKKVGQPFMFASNALLVSKLKFVYKEVLNMHDLIQTRPTIWMESENFDISFWKGFDHYNQSFLFWKEDWALGCNHVLLCLWWIQPILKCYKGSKDFVQDFRLLTWHTVKQNVINFGLFYWFYELHL